MAHRATRATWCRGLLAAVGAHERALPCVQVPNHEQLSGARWRGGGDLFLRALPVVSVGHANANTRDSFNSNYNQRAFLSPPMVGNI